jgi:hypothetical protein
VVFGVKNDLKKTPSETKIDPPGPKNHDFLMIFDRILTSFLVGHF